MKFFQKAVSALLTSVIVLGCGSALHADTGKKIEICDENFPDKRFREFVSLMYDRNCDWYLDDDEISRVTKIEYDGTQYLTDRVIKAKSLEGLQYFTSLQSLHLSKARVEVLDLTQMASLTDVMLISCEELRTIRIGSSVQSFKMSDFDYIDELDFSQAYNMTYLELLPTDRIYAKDVQTSLDFSNCHKLEKALFMFYPVKELKFSSQATKLTLNLVNTKITGIDFSNCKNLTYLDMWGVERPSLKLPFQLFNICNAYYLVSSKGYHATYKGNGCYLSY